MYIMTTIRR